MAASMVIFIRIASVLGAAGVVLGAMGAHGGVNQKLLEVGGMAHWQTASDYHLPHAVALLALGLFAGRAKALQGAWWAMFLGVLLFSGSLYTLAITQIKWLGAITPFGGLLMIVGWVLSALGAGAVTKDQAATRS